MRGLLAVLAGMLCAGALAVAGDVYRWRDASGVIHFTDDPSRIPPGARPVQAHPERLIVMEQPEAGRQKDGKENPGAEDGGALFAKRCGQCHVLFPEEDPNKEALIEVLRDADTEAPRPLKEVVREFRRAADGRFSDMDAIEISDDELRAIAKALLAQLR